MRRHGKLLGLARDLVQRLRVERLAQARDAAPAAVADLLHGTTRRLRRVRSVERVQGSLRSSEHSCPGGVVEYNPARGGGVATQPRHRRMAEFSPELAAARPPAGGGRAACRAQAAARTSAAGFSVTVPAAVTAAGC